MSDFDAAKAFAEAHERAKTTPPKGDTPHGAHWVPLVAAILAVLAALASLATTQRSTTALISKNQAILLFTKASDAYNEYESRSIKQHIYEALVASGNARDPKKLQAIAEHEKTSGAPAFKKAQDYERQAAESNARSERALAAIEFLEIGVTLLDISIVLVSISALATTRILTVAAVSAATIGLALALFGYFT
jgi:hypothetical protein